MIPASNQSSKPSLLVTIALTTVIIAAIYLAKGVLIPFTLAVLLSFCLSPLCDWLERFKIGRMPAVLLTAVFGFTLLGIIAWTTVIQVTHLAPKIPEYQHNIETRFATINRFAAQALIRITRATPLEVASPSQITERKPPTGTTELPFTVRVESTPTSPLQIFGGMYGRLLEVLGTTGIVIVLVVFFLIRREDLRDRFIHIVGKGHVTLTTQMLEDAGARISRYLSMLLLINIAFGISVYIGLLLIGVPNAMLWGVLAAALRFIPYIGPWIAAAMPLGLSLAISTGWWVPLLTVGLFVILELFNNNFLEPWVYGKNTGVSAVAVLMAAVFWMWLWGPAGLLLATPLTVCILVVGKHIPQLSFLDILLGTEPVFEPKIRIYQRLLAGDQEDASELLDGFVKDKPLVEIYDGVLIPALAMAETHWQLGDLNEEKHEFIIQSLGEMIAEIGDRAKELQSKAALKDAASLLDNPSLGEQTPVHEISIICIPSRTIADELTNAMLAQVLEQDGRSVRTIPLSKLAAMDFEIDESIDADIIILSATHPAAVMHARHLCKRVRNRLPNANLVVGLWGSQANLDRAKERIGCEATVTGTLTDAQTYIRQLMQNQQLQPSS